MLDQVLGPGQAVVRVASELDYSQVQETSERYDPKNSVIKTETSTTESTSTHSQDSASSAGVTANNSSPDASGKQNDQKKENTSNEYDVSKTVESRVAGVGVIKRLTIALMLNEKRPPAGSPAGTKAVPRTAQEIQSLENLVKAAVGFTQSDTRQDLIQSQEVPFADLFDETAPVEAKKKTVAEEMNDYLPYVTQGCLILLAIGILLYFRSALFSPVNKDVAEPDSFETLLSSYQTQTNGNGHAPRTNGTHGVTGALTPAELSRLIRENPDNASQALKQWMRRN
jgi:flagellar M-ring protein FliF